MMPLTDAYDIPMPDHSHPHPHSHSHSAPAAPKPKPHVELEQLTKQRDEYLDGWKRAKADYLNLKKEAEKEKKELIEFANAALLVQLLPLYDHFKRALAAIPEGERAKDWEKGVEAIFREFQLMLKALGVEEIPTVGQKFDPEKHHAVGKEKRAGAAPDTVLTETQTGFTLKGRVLGPAQVIVSE
jgi:molecular chaperone GrpE